MLLGNVLTVKFTNIPKIVNFKQTPLNAKFEFFLLVPRNLILRLGLHSLLVSI